MIYLLILILIRKRDNLIEQFSSLREHIFRCVLPWMYFCASLTRAIAAGMRSTAAYLSVSTNRLFSFFASNNKSFQLLGGSPFLSILLKTE